MGRITDFFWKNSHTIMKIYFPTMFTFGFYQSLHSINYYDYKDGKIPKDNELLVDKTVKGCYFGTMYASWYGPIAIYQALGRLEIKLSNKNPYDYETFYTELLSYTTLRPKQKKDK